MNRLLFLGTSGGHYVPTDSGEFFRRDPAALVNSELMIDCGMHVFDYPGYIADPHFYNKVTDIILTHEHYDHFNRDSVLRLAETNKLRIGCDKQIMHTIGAHPNIEYILLTPFVTVKMGNYEITPLLANHHIITNGDSCAFHFIVKTADKKRLFYGLDGAWFLRPSWEIMKAHKFDVMVFDCTVGDKSDWRLFEHNTIPMLRMMVEGVRTENMLTEGAVLVASHMAKKLHATPEETEKILQEFGMTGAYDGLTIQF